MQNEALYQKYRSQAFDEVVGQDYVVRSVYNAIKNNKVGHAYLFCGPRGTGKTTMARLLARAVNCENPAEAPCGHCTNCLAAKENNHPDIIEINAANETHVEDIRDLIERARLAPMMGEKKIYIIDEVHQLSSSAASALLKTLEEPPEHVIFILATTDPQKLLGTIISRCQRFDFSKVPTEKIKDHLLFVSHEEGIKLEEEAALKIAQLADGGMRDALSMLEQASSYASGNIQEKDVDEIYGLASTEEKLKLIDAILEKDLSSVLERIETYSNRGVDLKRLTSDLQDALKESVIYAYTKKESLLRTIHAKEAESILAKANAKELLNMVQVLMQAQDSYRYAQSLSSVFEIACMNLIAESEEAPIPQKQVVQEVPEEKPAPKVKKEKEVKAQVLEEVEVLPLLVQCDKESKSNDERKLNAFLNEAPRDRYVASLKQVTLRASGKDCLLFSSEVQAIVNTLNEEKMNQAIYAYLVEHIGIDKMPYVVTNDRYEEAVKQFVECRKNNTLPEPLVIERYEIKKEKGEEPTSLEKLQEVFQEDGILEVYD
ncbi:MAG: DNA polymerase III subunit gamma/tau [Solobacterium sp.]|nr:DNA polymerase III subunit gamma/tau [Solobacterium sp.]